jgi:hypothetical protein
MIQSLINNISQQCSDWHSQNLLWFEHHEFDLQSLKDLTTKLVYHNYCIWHFIEGYQDPNTQKVNFVYLGGLEHNRYRNDTVELIDNIFISKYQIGQGLYNSETLGSILDRISNCIIKIAHLKENNDSRVSLVETQLEFLTNCAIELFDDMTLGKRQITNFSRFKTSGYVK